MVKRNCKHKFRIRAAMQPFFENKSGMTFTWRRIYRGTGTFCGWQSFGLYRVVAEWHWSRIFAMAWTGDPLSGTRCLHHSGMHSVGFACVWCHRWLMWTGLPAVSLGRFSLILDIGWRDLWSSETGFVTKTWTLIHLSWFWINWLLFLVNCDGGRFFLENKSPAENYGYTESLRIQAQIHYRPIVESFWSYS